MLHYIMFIMGGAVSRFAQLDSETLIYIGGDTLGVPWLQGKNNTVKGENKDIGVNGGYYMNQNEGLNYSMVKQCTL